MKRAGTCGIMESGKGTGNKAKESRATETRGRGLRCRVVGRVRFGQPKGKGFGVAGFKGPKSTVRKATCWMIESFGARRIGEASILGPNSQVGVLVYPTPLKPGFRCIRTLGFDEEPWTGEVARRRGDYIQPFNRNC